jgi:hypothetical protein
MFRLENEQRKSGGEGGDDPARRSRRLKRDFPESGADAGGVSRPAQVLAPRQPHIGRSIK